MNGQPFQDAQSALGYVLEQGRNIETRVYRLRYPTFDIAPHVTVKTEGNEWAVGTIFFTQDSVGEATWLAGSSTDMPFNELLRSKYGRDFHMFGSGFEWNLEEINQARLLGVDTVGDKAVGTRRTADMFNYNVAMRGSAEKGLTGLVNSAEVPVVAILADGDENGGTDSALFEHKTNAQRLRDLNAALTFVSTSTNEIEYASSIRLPPSILRIMSTTLIGPGDGAMTLLDVFRKTNVYTSTTDQPLDIRALRDLETAGAGGTRRIMVYRNEEEVVRYHMPMPFKMLPFRQKSLMGFEAGGICRTGGTEWRLPQAAAYADGL